MSNDNSKNASFYEKINNEVLLQSIKTGEVFFCIKCQSFKRIDEFNKNQKWCNTCRKIILNNESILCECGRKIYLRCHVKRVDKL